MRNLVVSFGGDSPAVITAVERISWEKFATWLTKEPREVSDKDALGWYIPAEFDPVYRDNQNFVARHAITFDFDHVTIDTWGDVINAWSETAFAMYTTFSHRPESPRFRVVMPLSRPAGYDEFQAVARKVGSNVGIELIARESFVPAQMMFCPARPIGGQFVSRINDGVWIQVDDVLAEYADWTDASTWPHRRDGDAVHASSAEKIDPRDKPGIIGEFNRAFTVSQAIERFDLPYRRVK
jgi:putative DNA primase/helicase